MLCVEGRTGYLHQPTWKLNNDNVLITGRVVSSVVPERLPWFQPKLVTLATSPWWIPIILSSSKECWLLKIGHSVLQCGEKKLHVVCIIAASIIQLNKYYFLGSRDGSKLCCTVFSKQIWQLFKALQVFYKTISHPGSNSQISLALMNLPKKIR